MTLFPILPPIHTPRFEFIVNTHVAGGDNPTDFASVSFGSGGANGDILVLAIGWNNGSAPSAMTVAGEAATLVAALSNGSNPDQARCAMYYIVAPAAASGTVSVTFSSSAPGGAGVDLGIWRLGMLNSNTPADSDTDGGFPMDWVVNAPKNSIVIAATSGDNGGTGDGTGITRDYSGNSNRHGGGSVKVLAADTTYDVALPVGAGSQCGIAAVWR